MNKKEWYIEHECCPKCGSKNLGQTYLGCIEINGIYHDDMNNADCKCGWKGKVEDLVRDVK